MALVQGQNIPPSLATAYGRHIRSNTSWEYTGTQSGINGQQFYGVEPDNRNYLLRQAHFAADWLAERHAPTLRGRALAEWRTPIIADILAGSFSPEYFEAGVLLNDFTQEKIPECFLDADGVDPAYADPARVASYCRYHGYTSNYVTPAPNTEPPNPSPGWFGDVQGGEFQDRWAAQRRLDYNFQSFVFTKDRRPLFIVADCQWDLSASFRGNRLWASANVMALHWNNLTTPDDYWRQAHFHPNHNWVHRFPVAPAATPWAETINRRIITDVTKRHGAKLLNNRKNISLYLAPSPPFGRYFARNDWCRCWFSSSVAVYNAID